MKRNFEQLLVRNCCMLLLSNRYTSKSQDRVVVDLVDKIVDKDEYCKEDYENILHVVYWLSPADYNSEKRLCIVKEDFEYLRKMCLCRKHLEMKDTKKKSENK